MMNVYLCEDEEGQRKIIEQIIENIILIEDLDMKLVLSTESPSKVLENIRYSERVGIYFLDVDLKTNVTGLELAKEIRKIDSRGFIVFITAHSELSYMTFIYQLEALDYILKNQGYEAMKNRLKKCLYEASRRFALGNKVKSVFSVRINGKIYTMDYDEILFFETSSTVHKIIVHCKNRQMEFYGKLRDIENLLDERFYKCHKSFIVNKNNIATVDYQAKMIYMINGEVCLSSIRLVKGLLNK